MSLGRSSTPRARVAMRLPSLKGFSEVPPHDCFWCSGVGTENRSAPGIRLRMLALRCFAVLRVQRPSSLRVSYVMCVEFHFGDHPHVERKAYLARSFKEPMKQDFDSRIAVAKHIEDRFCCCKTH